LPKRPKLQFPYANFNFFSQVARQLTPELTNGKSAKTDQQ
jgi:hypothetical protein